MGAPRPYSKKQVMDLIARGTSLADADLRGTDLSGVCFDGADLQRAKLADCNLAKATFRGTDLTSASLWHADCKDACFDEAILVHTDLDLTNLDGATFRGARIRKSIFPTTRVSHDQINRSVRTGRKVEMQSFR